MKSWTHNDFVIHQFDQLESTNSHAFALANLLQISDREIILANSQNQGRGRQNRNWSSPVGNLYFSLVLQPKVSAAKIPQISFVAIAALRLAIARLTTNYLVQSKWPNDLLIDEKKVAGLLLESKILGDNCQFVILGIGLNIDSNPDQTIFPAANLKNFAIDISAKIALEIFLNEFEKIYQNWLSFGFKSIRQLWLQNAFRLQQKISVKLEEKTVEGIFDDLDEEGNLLLKTSDKILKISAADIFFKYTKSKLY